MVWVPEDDVKHALPIYAPHSLCACQSQPPQNILIGKITSHPLTGFWAIKRRDFDMVIVLLFRDPYLIPVFRFILSQFLTDVFYFSRIKFVPPMGIDHLEACDSPTSTHPVVRVLFWRNERGFRWARSETTERGVLEMGLNN